MEKTCVWEEDCDGEYTTTCGYDFDQLNGSPLDYKMRYCGFCGKPLTVIRYTEGQSDEVRHVWK
jgi:hypothetical protein